MVEQTADVVTSAESQSWSQGSGEVLGLIDPVGQADIALRAFFNSSSLSGWRLTADLPEELNLVKL